MSIYYHLGQSAYWLGLKRHKDIRLCRVMRIMNIADRYRAMRDWKRGWRDAARGLVP